MVSSTILLYTKSITKVNNFAKYFYIKYNMAMAVEYNREIYFTWRAINGYNKAINFAMSPREPGKTTSYWFEH